MAKGDIYFHSNFPFSDGTFGQKFFIILFEPEPSSSEPYLVIKTTSKLKGRQFNIGCNEKSRAFYIPQNNVSAFPANTLLQIQEIFEFSVSEFLKGCLTEKVIEHKGTLSEITIAQLINCIKKIKEDVSEKHYELITRK